MWLVRIAVCFVLFQHISYEDDELIEIAKRPEMTAMRYFVCIVTHILV